MSEAGQRLLEAAFWGEEYAERRSALDAAVASQQVTRLERLHRLQAIFWAYAIGGAESQEQAHEALSRMLLMVVYSDFSSS